MKLTCFKGLLLRTSAGASQHRSRRTVNVDENPTGQQRELLDIDARLNEWRDRHVTVLVSDDVLIVLRED